MHGVGVSLHSGSIHDLMLTFQNKYLSPECLKGGNYKIERRACYKIVLVYLHVGTWQISLYIYIHFEYN